MKQGRVHGGKAASTQAEVGDVSVAAAGAEVGEVSPEVEKPAVVFVSWMSLSPLFFVLFFAISGNYDRNFGDRYDRGFSSGGGDRGYSGGGGGGGGYRSGGGGGSGGYSGGYRDNR